MPGTALTRPGVGVASQRLRRGTVDSGPASAAGRPGVASHRLPPAAGVAPPAASQLRPGVSAGGWPGVASQRATAGVASTASHSLRGFLLQTGRVLVLCH